MAGRRISRPSLPPSNAPPPPQTECLQQQAPLRPPSRLRRASISNSNSIGPRASTDTTSLPPQQHQQNKKVIREERRADRHHLCLQHEESLQQHRATTSSGRPPLPTMPTIRTLMTMTMKRRRWRRKMPLLQSRSRLFRPTQRGRSQRPPLPRRQPLRRRHRVVLVGGKHRLRRYREPLCPPRRREAHAPLGTTMTRRQVRVIGSESPPPLPHRTLHRRLRP